MFKKRYSLESINVGFYVQNDLAVMQKNDQLIQIKSSTNEIINSIKLPVNCNIQRVEKRRNEYLGLQNGKVLHFGLDLELLKETKIRFAGYHVFENNYLISILDTNYNTSERKCGLYSLDFDKNLWEAGYSKTILTLSEGKNIFSLDLNTIEKRQFKDGKVLWVFKFDGDPKGIYPKIIATTKRTIIFGLESQDKLLALDLETGALVWERTTIPDLFKLDENGNKLHVISGGYKCLDANTGVEMESFDDRTYFDQVGILSQRNNYVISDEHIITTDYKKGIIGAFNIKTHQFDWVHEEEGVSFPAGSPVVYSNPYLFVHDGKGTLHVFEKTEL